MPLSTNQLKNLKSAIASALAANKLDNWQTTFVTDMQTRIARYGTKTNFSEKQRTKLYQILQPYWPQTSERQPPQPQPQSRSYRKKAVPIPRINLLPPRRGARRLKGEFRKVTYIVALIGIVVLAVSNMLPGPSLESTGSLTNNGAYQLNAASITVVDGDTIKIRGNSASVRLVGFNTPETYEPRCDQGLALGRQATSRLKELVRRANAIELQLVACACPPSIQGTSECNFGRSCGVLRVDSVDVGRTLVSEGLAAPFICGRTSCPPLPRPWCN